MKIDPKIKEDLKRRLKEDLNERKHEVRVVAAYKPDTKELDALKDKFPDLKNHDVIIEVDPELIAGYIIKFGSKVIDVSLRGQLQNYKNLIYEIDR